MEMKQKYKDVINKIQTSPKGKDGEEHNQFMKSLKGYAERYNVEYTGIVDIFTHLMAKNMEKEAEEFYAYLSDYSSHM